MKKEGFDLNSQRFIRAYNKLDKAIRHAYNVKSNVGFSEMIRQKSALNALLKKYEDDLYDYSRLRNAIVHNFCTDEAIAEPHLRVVEKLERIAELMAAPPLVVNVFEQTEIFALKADDTLQTVLVGSAKRSFTHLPVYDENQIVGVVNPKNITEALGVELSKNGKISPEFLSSTTVSQIRFKNADDYLFASTALSVVDALTLFQKNRRLRAIMITKDGTATAPVLRLVTSKDIIEFQI